MAAAVPTLPFVVLQAHKPSAPHEILTATAITSAPEPSVSATPTGAGIGGIGGGTNAAATIMTRSSSVSLHPPRSVSSDISHLKSASSSAGVGLSSSGAPLSGGDGGVLMSVGMHRSSTAPIPQRHNPYITSSTSTATATTATAAMSTSSGLTPPQLPTASSSVQTRTLHPHIHYIFESDPLETEILESIPKSQCITMDFDPRSGVVKNVESYLTQLQVMDVRLVQSFGQEGQGALGGPSSSLSPPSASASGTGMGTGSGGVDAGVGAVSTSSSASSLKATTTTTTGTGGGGTTDESQTHSATAPPQPSTSPPSSSSSGAPGRTLLARNNSMSSSTLQSSFRTSRRSADKGARGDVSVGDDKSSSFSTATTATVASKDWTLVIDAVELDRRDQESDSQLLEQSMVSSLDTDSIPEDYLLHCEAIMKSFSARNLLLRKVIDYANATSSPTGTPP